MQTVFIGADHRGFKLKNSIIEYLQQHDIRVEDMGNMVEDPNDDYPEYANKVATALLQNPSEFMGITICGSGIGVSMAANRHKGIRCGLCLTVDAAHHGRANDHINVLALASDYTSEEEAFKIVKTFLQTPVNEAEKYLRRAHQLDEVPEPHIPPSRQ